MNDDQLDELLRSAGRDYNAPPPVPREAMWARIAEARAAARTEAASAAPNEAPDEAPAATPAVVAPRVVPGITSLDAARAKRAARPWRRHAGWVSGLAATLLVGIGLGRLSTGGTAVPATSTARSPVSSTPPSPTPSPTPSSAVAVAPSTSAPVVASPASSEPTPNEGGAPRIPAPPAAALRRSSTPRTLAARAPEPARDDEAESPSARRREAVALPYRVAAVQHLATTEALLVALRADGRAGGPDTSLARWAGDLLGTTRQLLDSPAADEPQLRRLLEDLELVLAQIARLPGAGQPRERQSELDLIDQALQRRHVLTRLRTLDAPRT